MMERMCSVSPADTGCSMDSPVPEQQDPHSSEEELEVINNTREERSPLPLLHATSICLPEKRKWSEMGGGDSYSRRYSPENEENMSHYSNLSPSSPTTCTKRYSSASSNEAVHVEHSGSSDEEVHGLLIGISTPVQFRTSPPLEALKLCGRTPNSTTQKSSNPPAKLLHYEVSPRKRSRHTRQTHIQRPYLDFEKMQQVLCASFYFVCWYEVYKKILTLNVMCEARYTFLYLHILL